MPTSPPVIARSTRSPGPAPTSTPRTGVTVRVARWSTPSRITRSAPGVSTTSSRAPPSRATTTVHSGPLRTAPTGATQVPSRTRQSFSKTSVAAAGWIVESTPRCGIMKIESTAISVMPSTWNASIIISIDCARRGA